MGHSITPPSNAVQALPRLLGAALTRLGALLEQAAAPRVRGPATANRVTRPAWVQAVATAPGATEPARTAPEPTVGARSPVLRVRAATPSAGRSASHTGTCLVLSGRMQDVCSELDRLAALEARQLQLI